MHLGDWLGDQQTWIKINLIFPFMACIVIIQKDNFIQPILPIAQKLDFICKIPNYITWEITCSIMISKEKKLDRIKKSIVMLKIKHTLL